MALSWISGCGVRVDSLLLRTVPARIAAGIQYLQPVVGVAAAAVMFGDELGLFFVLGVLLVLGGLALTVTERRRATA